MSEKIYSPGPIAIQSHTFENIFTVAYLALKALSLSLSLSASGLRKAVYQTFVERKRVYSLIVTRQSCVLLPNLCRFLKFPDKCIAWTWKLRTKLTFQINLQYFEIFISLRGDLLAISINISSGKNSSLFKYTLIAPPCV